MITEFKIQTKKTPALDINPVGLSEVSAAVAKHAYKRTFEVHITNRICVRNEVVHVSHLRRLT